MKKFKNPFIVAVLAGSLLSQFLVTYSQPTVTTVITASDIRSESQLRTEASLYDAAIADIQKGISIKLETADDLKAADALLKKAIPNLRFNRSKLVVLGMGDSTFASAVKERTRDSKTTEEFARVLANDPNEILKLNGATTLQSRLTRSLESDVALLQNVAARLKKAADAVRAKTNANHPILISALSRDNKERALVLPVTTLHSAPPGPLLDIITIQLVTIALVIQPAIFLVLVGTGLGSTIVIVGAAILVAKIIGNIGSDKGRDKVAECEDKATQKMNDCLATANVITLAFVDAYCTAQYLLDAGACLVA